MLKMPAYRDRLTVFTRDQLKAWREVHHFDVEQQVLGVVEEWEHYDITVTQADVDDMVYQHCYFSENESEEELRELVYAYMDRLDDEQNKE